MPLTISLFDRVDEVIHNVTVRDPYRWLEDRWSPYTEKWIADQRLRCDAYFSLRTALAEIKTRVAKHLNVEAIDQPAQVGDCLFFRRRAINQQQGSICVKELANGLERKLVDPSPGGSFMSVGIHHVSSDGAFLAYEIKYGGQAVTAIGVVEVSSGSVLPDMIQCGYPRGLAFAPTRFGFYYCHEAPGDKADHSIRFHRFGRTPNDDDPILFSVPRSPSSRLRLTSDETRLGAVYSYLHGRESVVDFFIASRERDLEWRPIFQRAKAPYTPSLKHGRIFVFARTGASTDHLIEISQRGTILHEVVPACDLEIHQLVFVGDRVYVKYQSDQNTFIRAWALSGQFAGSIPLPAQGTVHLLPCLSDHTDTLFYTHESFTEPPTIFQHNPSNDISLPWSTITAGTEGHSGSIERIHFRSADGIEVPMLMVGCGDLAMRHPRPTIMTRYGGFGISMTPQFSVLATLMLELGAVFVVPNIRGGSELGRAWYEAARGKRRQVAFDDFIAAAQWLCEQRITTPNQLAIFGGSNSGLLVGAAMTQRPDLFRAVLCISPLLDMVRYEQFDDARRARAEYGTVDDREDFLSLYAYSPYHHVQEGVNYPATLFVTGDNDTSCNPAHVRKMAALLQVRRAQTNPILVDYLAERGHSAALPLDVRIDALSRRVIFLCNELGMNVPIGGRP